MYILTEEEYRNLSMAGNTSPLGVQEFIDHFAFYECKECGRLIAMEKSKKDTPKDLQTLAQGCPGCGENITPFAGNAEGLVKRVIK